MFDRRWPNNRLFVALFPTARQNKIKGNASVEGTRLSCHLDRMHFGAGSLYPRIIENEMKF